MSNYWKRAERLISLLQQAEEATRLQHADAQQAEISKLANKLAQKDQGQDLDELRTRLSHGANTRPDDSSNSWQSLGDIKDSTLEE